MSTSEAWFDGNLPIQEVMKDIADLCEKEKIEIRKFQNRPEHGILVVKFKGVDE